jgi:outer membrane lipoprotein SlyB
MSAMTITANQLATIQQYTDTDPVSTLKRAFDFGAKHPIVVIQVVTGTVIGASVGAAAGKVLGTAVAAAVPATAPFAPEVGAIAGGLLVGGLAVRYQLQQVQASEKFWQYKGEEAKKVYQQLKEQFPEIDMEDYECPIRAELIEVPVRGDKCEKHVFEAAALNESIEKNGTDCPVCRKTLDSLVYVSDYHPLVFQKINDLFKAKSQL